MNYRNSTTGAPKCADPVPSTHASSGNASGKSSGTSGGSGTGGIGSASSQNSGASGSSGAGGGYGVQHASGSTNNGGSSSGSNGSNANYTNINPAASVAAGAHAATERVKSYLHSSSSPSSSSSWCGGMFANKKQCMLIGTGMVLCFLAGAASLYMLQRYEESLDDKAASPEERKASPRTFSPRRTI